MTFNFIALTCLIVLSSNFSWANDFQFGDLQIEITQTPNSSLGQRDGSIKVRRVNSIIAEKTFKQMESLGGSNGFYLPKHQPREDLFFVTKQGDYNGRILAITKEGAILNLPDGTIYTDDSYLYSVRQSEVEGDAYAIVNLKTMKVVKEGEILPSSINSKLKTMKSIFPGLFYQLWQPLSK